MDRPLGPKWRVMILLALAFAQVGCASKADKSESASAVENETAVAAGDMDLDSPATGSTASPVEEPASSGAARSNSQSSSQHTFAANSPLKSKKNGFKQNTQSAGHEQPKVSMTMTRSGSSASSSATIGSTPSSAATAPAFPLALQAELGVPNNPLRELPTTSATGNSSLQATSPRRFPGGATNAIETALANSPPSLQPADEQGGFPVGQAPFAEQTVMPAAAVAAKTDLDLPPGAHVAKVRFATDRLPLVDLLPSTAHVFARSAAVLFVLCGLTLGCLLAKRLRGLWMIGCAAASALLVLALHGDSVRLQQVNRLAENNQSVFTTMRYESGGDYPLHLGEATVSLPPMHEKGKMESVSIAKLEFVETPGKHIVLHQVSIEEDVDKWFSDIGKEVADSGDGHVPPLANGSGAFIFVHGYNVRFDDALKRTAQLSHDLGIAGPAICYSWPSKGNVAGYSADESTVNWSAPHLERLILDLREQSNVKSINLIAHSMGNRALLQAVERLHLRMSNEKDPEPIIDRLVMAAPDVDAQAFSGRYIESLEEAVSSATLYFSSSDRALWLSRLLHGGKRVGLDVVTRNVGNLEAVDIGPQAFFSTGHSYYGSDPVVIDDLSALLRQHAAAPQRPWLTPQRVASAEFWLLDRQRHAEATTAIRR